MEASTIRLFNRSLMAWLGAQWCKLALAPSTTHFVLLSQSLPLAGQVRSLVVLFTALPCQGTGPPRENILPATNTVGLGLGSSAACAVAQLRFQWRTRVYAECPDETLIGAGLVRQ